MSRGNPVVAVQTLLSEAKSALIEIVIVRSDYLYLSGDWRESVGIL